MYPFPIGMHTIVNGRTSQPSGQPHRSILLGIVNSREVGVKPSTPMDTSVYSAPTVVRKHRVHNRQDRQILKPPESRLLTEVFTGNHWLNWYEGGKHDDIYWVSVNYSSPRDQASQYSRLYQFRLCPLVIQAQLAGFGGICLASLNSRGIRSYCRAVSAGFPVKSFPPAIPPTVPVLGPALTIAPHLTCPVPSAAPFLSAPASRNLAQAAQQQLSAFSNSSNKGQVKSSC